MNIRVVYLSSVNGVQAGEVVCLNSFSARRAVESGAACYYSDYSPEMLKSQKGVEPSLASDTDASESDKKKASKKG